MNNVISIVVDSVIKGYVGTDICAVSPTPFLDSLRKESIVANNMYSPGPFTDAATKSLFTGRDCLDDYSFFFKYSASPINHYKAFKERGFETIGIYYPYYISGKNVTDYIDNLYYASGFVFTSEWFGMFSYFADIIKSRTLTELECKLLNARLKLLFDVWIKFYNDIITTPASAIMIEKCIGDFYVSGALDILKTEYNSFLSNQNDYLIDFLKQGESHVLATLDKIDVEGYIDRNYLKEKVYGRFAEDFKYFKKENFKSNVKRFPSIKRLLYTTKEIIKTNSLDPAKCIANYYACLTSFGRMQRLSMNPVWQYEQSSYRHFETAKYAIEHRKTNNPFYLSVHVEEPHNYIACFTYDSQDDRMLAEEFNVLREYVKQLNGRFKGDLSYILSIRYVDYQIEKFCDYLKKKGLWGNTTLLVCADHGSSYSFYPLHTNRVNCFDTECYHIPMMIRKPGLNRKVIDGYCNSKDILPTLFDIEGLGVDNRFTGVSVLKSTKEDYVITEYPGGGCPDVNSKPLKLSIRDARFIVGYNIQIHENLLDRKPSEIYDLKNDPNGYYNLASSKELPDIGYLLKPLNDYFEKIRARNTEFIQTLEDNLQTL